jgi:hypothetical protein
VVIRKTVGANHKNAPSAAKKRPSKKRSLDVEIEVFSFDVWVSTHVPAIERDSFVLNETPGFFSFASVLHCKYQRNINDFAMEGDEK